ncbi:MAG: fused MFS/spermidine synthase, partial [Candidatus Methanoperedens sp.]
PGDYMKFYEINPEIVRIARNPEYFTYLSECPATVDITMGDARISMEQELRKGQPQNFDVLVIDAFNSDSVPVHLLTREAFKLYLSHITPGGIIAVHVSSTYIDLVPPVWAQKKYFDLEGVVIRVGKNYAHNVDPSVWVLLSRDPSIFLMPSIAKARMNPDLISPAKSWTDDYSSLLSAVKEADITVHSAVVILKDLFRPRKQTVTWPHKLPIEQAKDKIDILLK